MSRGSTRPEIAAYDRLITTLHPDSREAALQRQIAARDWAAVMIQSHVRRFQAVNVTVNRKIELGLNERLARVAHRFLESGDLWGFLKAVDDDYRRYEQEKQDEMKREDEMAVTFIKRVLESRQQQHRAGWSAFHKLVGTAGHDKEGLMTDRR